MDSLHEACCLTYHVKAAVDEHHLELGLIHVGELGACDGDAVVVVQGEASVSDVRGAGPDGSAVDDQELIVHQVGSRVRDDRDAGAD